MGGAHIGMAHGRTYARLQQTFRCPIRHKKLEKSAGLEAILEWRIGRLALSYGIATHCCLESNLNDFILYNRFYFAVQLLSMLFEAVVFGLIVEGQPLPTCAIC